MKNLKDIREASVAQVLAAARKNDDSPKNDTLTKLDTRFKAGYPSDKQIPSVLLLKRKAIRVYPDSQKVALYYAQTIDKYVTISFGQDGVDSVNEAVGYNTKNPMPDKDERRTNGYYAKLANDTFAKSLEHEKAGNRQLAQLTRNFALKYAATHMSLGGRESDINLPPTMTVAPAPKEPKQAAPKPEAPKQTTPKPKKATITAKAPQPVWKATTVNQKTPSQSVPPTQPKPATPSVAAQQNQDAKKTSAGKTFLQKLTPKGETLMGDPPGGMEGVGYLAGRTAALGAAAAVHGSIAAGKAVKNTLQKRKMASLPNTSLSTPSGEAAPAKPGLISRAVDGVKSFIARKALGALSESEIEKIQGVYENLSDENKEKFKSMISEEATCSEVIQFALNIKKETR